MKNIISLKILTPEKIIYQDDVFEITLPTEAGEIGILPDHSPLVSIIKTGEIRIKKEQGGQVVPLSVASGILEVRPSSKDKDKNSEVIILASNSEFASDIDIQRAEEAFNRAKKAMEEKENMSDIDFSKLQAVIDKELNRFNVAKKWKR